MSDELAKFRVGDIEKILKELSENSSTSEGIKSNLKAFLVLSFQSKDIANEIISNRAITVLVDLYNSERGKAFKGQIACVLLLLSFEGSGDDERTVLDVTITALSNIFSKSDTSVFLECVSGIKSIATFSAPSSSSSSSFSSSGEEEEDAPSSPPAHFLSVLSSALLFDKTAKLLSSPSVAELAKVEVLDILVKLADAGLMNEAAAFVAWSQAQTQTTLPHSSGSGGGGGGVDSALSVVRFIKAFESFTDTVKKISLAKKKSVLRSAADDVYRSIQDKTFFPTFASTSLKTVEPGKKQTTLAPVTLSLKFLPNSSASNVTNSGNKLTWNSTAWRSFFVDPEMVDGVYKITLEKDGSNTSIYFGVAAKSVLAALAPNHINSQSGSGVCFIYSSGIHRGFGTDAVSGTSFFSTSGKAVLGLELNADRHTLHFFVNGVQIPHCVAGIPPSVHFAVSDYSQGVSIELKSLERLSAPTVDASLACTQHEWVK